MLPYLKITVALFEDLDAILKALREYDKADEDVALKASTISNMAKKAKFFHEDCNDTKF